MEMTKKDKYSVGGWTDLCWDLLTQIKCHLSLHDLVHFNFVCSNWRSVSVKQVRYVSRMPWLIVPYVVDDRSGSADRHLNMCRDGVLGFYSIIDGVTYKVEIPELYERRICGSSFGWLISVHANSEMQLVNPLSRKVLNLPALTNSPDVVGTIVSENRGVFYRVSGYLNRESYADWHQSAVDLRESFIYKAITSPESDSMVQTPIVVCLPLKLANLFFCRQGDESWTTIDCQNNRYSDITFFNGDLYALCMSGEVDIVRGLVGFSPPITSLFASISMTHDWRQTNNYLVASSTELLQVVRFYSIWVCPENVRTELHIRGDYRDEVMSVYSGCRFTEKFSVFRLDFTAQTWVEVKNLGDRALFVGSNDSFSVVASEFPECRGNCIYFSDDLKMRHFNGHDKGMYSLDDDKIEKICPINSKYICPRPFWYSAIQ
ncbi:hypothetical protein ACHQM5_012920 [Ranunculus cassubicifolius]